MNRKPCRIRPIRDNILVLPDPDDEKVGSIYLPQAQVELKKFCGTVIAVGDGHMVDVQRTFQDGSKEFISIPLRVKEGERIIYSKYAGSIIEQEGIEYVLIKEADVQAVISKAP